MTHPLIDEAAIRRLATPEIVSCGEDYYRSGHGLSSEQRGNMLRAEVAGRSYEPYQVAIELDESASATADCSCLYDGGGYCKHIVTVLLKYVREAGWIKRARRWKPTMEKTPWPSPASLRKRPSRAGRNSMIRMASSEPGSANWGRSLSRRC